MLPPGPAECENKSFGDNDLPASMTYDNNSFNGRAYVSILRVAVITIFIQAGRNRGNNAPLSALSYKKTKKMQVVI